MHAWSCGAHRVTTHLENLEKVREFQSGQGKWKNKTEKLG